MWLTSETNGLIEIKGTVLEVASGNSVKVRISYHEDRTYGCEFFIQVEGAGHALSKSLEGACGLDEAQREALSTASKVFERFDNADPSRGYALEIPMDYIEPTVKIWKNGSSYIVRHTDGKGKLFNKLGEAVEYMNEVLDK